MSLIECRGGRPRGYASNVMKKRVLKVDLHQKSNSMRNSETLIRQGIEFKSIHHVVILVVSKKLKYFLLGNEHFSYSDDRQASCTVA